MTSRVHGGIRPGGEPDPDTLLELSDERDRQLQRLLDAERDAYDLGIEIGIEIGRRQVLAEEAAAQRAAAGRLLAHSRLERDRWTVRGQRRDRASFADPRKGDRPCEHGRHFRRCPGCAGRAAA